MVELDKLEYHFKLDLELKYVFTHIEKSSLIKLLNTIFEIELPLDSDIEICNIEFVANNLSSLTTTK